MNKFSKLVLVMATLFGGYFCPVLSSAQSAPAAKTSGDPFEPAVKKEKRSAAPTEEIASKMALRGWSEACHLKGKAKLNKVYFRENPSESNNPFNEIESVRVLGEDNKPYDVNYSSLNADDREYVSNFVSWWNSHKDGSDKAEGGSLYHPPLAPHTHWRVKNTQKYTYTKTEVVGYDHRFPQRVPGPGNFTVYPPIYGPVKHTGTKFVYEPFDGDLESIDGKDATFKGGKVVPVARLQDTDRTWISKWRALNDKDSWTEKDGRVLNAKLVEVTPTKVKLEKADKSIKEIDTEKLCEKDQKFLKSLK